MDKSQAYIGQKVIFEERPYSNGRYRIPDFNIETHETTDSGGSVVLADNPDATVMAILDRGINVRYLNEYGTYTCLCFSPEVLTPAFTNWKERYQQ